MRYHILAVSAILSLVTGCGGGGGGGTSLPPVTNASPGGIWVGTDPLSPGHPVLGLVAETGELLFLDAGWTSGVYYVGQFKTDGSSINATVDAITTPGSQYPDRATSGTGTLGGHIVERTSIDGNVIINTDPATSIAGGQVFSTSLSLTFSDQYNRASSLTTIAGNYSSTYPDNYGTHTLALNISSDGELFAQDASTGCVINGMVSTIDTRFNLYAVTIATLNCATELGVPDGAQLKGLATLNNSQSPEYVIIGVSDTASPKKAAVMTSMNRM